MLLPINSGGACRGWEGQCLQLGLMNMNDLPDLPGLESIEEEVQEGWPCCCCLPAPIVIIGGVIQGYWLYGLIASAVLVALAFAFGWLSKRRIKTDTERLSVAWPFRRKLIAWENVTVATTVTNDSDPPERHVQVDAPGKRIRVPVTGPGMARLEASIWQHLRHVDKADGIELSEDARSFWFPIPEDIPAEMDWEMARELDYAHRARYSLRPSYVLCEFVEHEPDVKPTAIDFAAVASARWESCDDDNADSLDLMIESENDSIYIPLDPDDLNCARFLLAVIKRLRQVPQVKPLALPKRVREAPFGVVGGFSEPDSRA